MSSTAHRITSAAIVDEPLSRHTSLRVGGPAKRYLESSNVRAILSEIDEAARIGRPVLVIGGGSNLLPADSGFDGLVVKYSADSYTIQEGVDGFGVVKADAGATLSSLSRRLARQGWSGLEWASNVPGTVGGAAVNNAGAFGSSMAECLLDVWLIGQDGNELLLGNRDLDYGYRTSVLKRLELGRILVTSVRCAIRRGSPVETLGRVAEFQRSRTESQPRQLSAGSVFANPPGDAAGRLIESASLKGARIGGAEISTQHANFIVNLARATADDVYELMRMVQDTVWRRSGIWLEPEIELVGAWEPARLEALHGPARGRSETVS